jgi:hypothetical protein
MVLPAGVSINDQAIIATTSAGKKITNFDITTRDVGDGKVLWTVKLPDDICIGYYNETF